MKIERSVAEKYFNEFDKKKVLIVGDVMVDSYLLGKVNRISPEAPIPIVSVKERDYRLGGAANVALNVSALGAETILCSVIGDDEKGLIFENLLQKHNLKSDGIIKIKNRRTTVKTRIISQGQHLLRIDEEDSHHLEESVQTILFERIQKLIDLYKIDVIIMEDYDKGVLTPNLIEQITNLANSKNIITSVDPKKNNFNNYFGVSLFKPNLKEFSEGLKSEVDKNDISKLKVLATEFIHKTDIGIIMITLSEKGILIGNKNQMIHLPAYVRDIADVSGAGDTVISVASLLLASKATLTDIAAIANTAGGLVCEKTGVVPIKTNELLAEF
jgi:rfaE bifunctional protein kinase chain/domain